MDLRVLGSPTLGDGRIALTHRDRLVICALAARLGRAVSAESLADALWGEKPPASWRKVVAGCIMRLRRAIAPARIETTALGYRLDPEAVELDVESFERLAARGSQLLALKEPDRAGHAFAEALGLWRGPPYAELPDWEPARVEAFRLEDLRLAVEEALLDAQLQSGDLVDAATQARARVAESPLRERRWVILALAQYRQERQADALATVRRGRELLAAELGLDPCAELAALEQAILRQDPELQSGVTFRAASAECPYFGLPPATIDDGERYFGREDELKRGLDELDQHGVLVVSGSSGVGKSSFVRAGLGAHFAARGKRVTVSTPGERPLQMLREVADHDSESVLIVDQCEQAFANDDPNEVRRFFEEVARLVFRGMVVLAIRADRLGELSDQGFAGVIESHLLMLRPLSGDGLRSVIEKPAMQAGLILEPGLVEILTRDADGRSLPLLSHALHQVWQRREGRVLSVDGYRASGQIDGAVAQTAEEVFAELSDEGRGHARDILLRLVEPSDGGFICQRVSHTSVAIDDVHARVAGRLVDARLVTSDDESYQLAHEAVAREWPRLREWLVDDVEGQRIMRHLNAAATAWDAMSRPDSELYRGVRLNAARQWRASAAPVLAPVESAFLDAAGEREAADLNATERQLRRERRSVRRLRWLAGATACLAAVALAVGTVAVIQVGVLNKQAVIDEARHIAALAVEEPVYERALLMAVEAIGLWDAPTTRRALLDVMGESPRITSVTRVSGDAAVQQMSLGTDGSTAVIVGDDLTARMIDLDGRAQLFAYERGTDTVLDALPAPDGRLTLSVLTEDCDVRELCDAPFARSLEPRDAEGEATYYDGFKEVIDLEYSPDGSWVAAIAPLPWVDEPGNVAMWRADGSGAPQLLDLPDAGTNPGAPNWANAFGRVRFSPDGSRLYASGFGPTAIFDTHTGALVGELTGQGILAVSPDGEAVLMRDGQKAARIVDLADPDRSILLETPSTVIDGVFSPDGTRVVTTSGDRAWVWSTGTGDLRDSLEGHVGEVTSAAFRPSGELVTAGEDGALITWTMGDWSSSFRDWIREGSELLVPRDDRTLVFNDSEGRRVGIAADPEIWRDRACAIAGRSLTEAEWQELFNDRPYKPACQPSFADPSAELVP
ncbi:BTAD domain-containing putative transcriptional regulator [Microbacterium sp. CFBP9034]|uniref:nSTAND1 domain-containing NTPase n=1 Tax=Microbacterium sp. CFBP9034 TaxID=3096540 RepID=UPI002A6B8247|nr:BTAD domain-containing putative transcriptional regulator [Microbacterium sp. CFBP9034]MDY0908800.1 BTAD domain-containing putative transcriptional regulator [Microbacterium sp. CFBP9034]